MITLQAPHARYRQVADALRNAIKRGDYSPGSALPSQPDLARQYNLNQTSINRAIALLRAEGLVRVEHGRGAFVQEIPTVKRTRRIPREDQAGSSFADEMRKAGLDPRTELAGLDTVPAPADVAEHLRISAGEPVVRRTRHMFASGRPVQLAISYLPVEIAGGQDIALPDTGPTGLYKRLAGRGYRVVRFVEQIEARYPRPEEAEFLGLTEAQHVLEVTRIAYANDDLPVETVINVFPSQQWRLSYEWAAEKRKPVGELPRHSVSVTGIVFCDDGRVLAIQRADDGRWVPPGGVLELSETPADGVAREVLEETGIHVKVDQLTGVYKNMVRGIVTLAFRCYATGGDTHPGSEARQVAWLTVDEATRDMVEARAVRIIDALSGNGPFVRVHDGTHLL